MTFAAILTLLPMLLGMAGSGAPGDSQQVRRLVVQGQLIIRVPVRPPPSHLQFIERKGPQCLASRAIRGAFLSGNDHVDFMMMRGRRFRAELSADCPALDFYEGFYLSPQDDRLCARRDVIRSRIGGSCRIERFHYLVPKPRG